MSGESHKAEPALRHTPEKLWGEWQSSWENWRGRRKALWQDSGE
jgi:hypothetical protein